MIGTHIFGHGFVVGERKQIILEIASVVPDIQMLAKLAPLIEILDKSRGFGLGICLRLHFHGRAPAAFDIAKTNDHVICRTQAERRFFRILICEGVEHDVGIILADIVCQAVDEADHGSGGRSVSLIQFPTFGTAAVIVPVVLCDGEYLAIGIFLDPFAERFARLKKYAFVCQTGLCPFTQTFAVHHGEIFGVFIVVNIGRHKLVEGMVEVEEF